MTQHPDWAIWPMWAQHAQCEMDTLGLNFEVILTKVMLVAAAPQVFNGLTKTDTGYLIKRQLRNYELYVLGSWLGTTPEMAAYRWAKAERKELLNSP